MDVSVLFAIASGIFLLYFAVITVLNNYACSRLEEIDKAHTLLKYRILLYSFQPAQDSSPAEVVWNITSMTSVREGIPSFRFYRLVKKLMATGDDTELREACIRKRLTGRTN